MHFFIDIEYWVMIASIIYLKVIRFYCCSSLSNKQWTVFLLCFDCDKLIVSWWSGGHTIATGSLVITNFYRSSCLAFELVHSLTISVFANAMQKCCWPKGQRQYTACFPQFRPPLTRRERVVSSARWVDVRVEIHHFIWQSKIVHPVVRFQIVGGYPRIASHVCIAGLRAIRSDAIAKQVYFSSFRRPTVGKMTAWQEDIGRFIRGNRCRSRRVTPKIQ